MRKIGLVLGAAFGLAGGEASAQEAAKPIECVYRSIDPAAIPLIYGPTREGDAGQEEAVRKGRLAVAECTRRYSFTKRQSDASINYMWGRFNYEKGVARLRSHSQDPGLLDRLISGLSEAEADRVLGGDVAPIATTLNSWFQSSGLAASLSSQESRDLGMDIGRGAGGLLLLRRAGAQFDGE